MSELDELDELEKAASDSRLNYLERFLELAVQHLPGHIKERYQRSGRGYAGGKAPRGPQPLDLLEKLAIHAINPKTLEGMDDDELLSLHHRLHQLWNSPAINKAAKGPGPGWWGPPQGSHAPGNQGGETLRGVPGHVWQRAGERTGFQAVKQVVQSLRKKPVLPESKSQKWHCRLERGGWLVGSDAVAQTVLARGMKPYKGSMEIKP